jgi:predicted RNA polymerase sigma factor
MQRIIETKERLRRERADLPYPEKVRIVERLREAAAMMRAIGEREGFRKPAQQPTGPQVNLFKPKGEN